MEKDKPTAWFEVKILEGFKNSHHPDCEAWKSKNDSMEKDKPTAWFEVRFWRVLKIPTTQIVKGLEI